MNKLEQLKKHTIIVADTGEIDEIKKFKPTDATTNPSLIQAAASMEEYKHLVHEAIIWGKSHAKDSKHLLDAILTKIFVNFGVEILKYIPGRVSTEVDARLSFDVEGSIRKAHEYIALYEKAGIKKERVLIKLAATWEGIQAAKVLEKEGIHCNMTLMFCVAQAVACADAGATLISPFVGRILDWYTKSTGKTYSAEEDPGVKSVQTIYNTYKKFGYSTQIMGASFRNSGEILELCGCDLLTIAPKFLKELQESQGMIDRKLDPSKSKHLPLQKHSYDEKSFRWHLNEDAMATEKLSEGIRKFAEATLDLEKTLKTMM